MQSLFKLGMVFMAIDRLTGPARQMAKAVGDLEKSALRARKAMDFGRTMMTAGAAAGGAAYAIGAGLQQIIAPAAEVQDAMAPLKTVMTSTLGSVDASMALSRKTAMEWARTHTDSAAEVLRAQYMMASAGLNDVQSLEGARVALTVAKATMGDAADAANLVATAFNTLGDKTRPVKEEMERLGDVITRTQQFFQFKNLGQLSAGLNEAFAAAMASGTGMEELSVIIGQLNNAGMQGSRAGTAFAASMRQMLKASESLGFQIARDAEGNTSLIGTLMNIQAQFGPMSQWSDDLRMKFQDAFGDEGLRAISLLLPKIQDMRGALGEVTDSAGAAAAAQKEMESNLGAQWQIAVNNFNELKMMLGDTLAPILQGALPTLRGWVDGLKSFSQAHPTLTRTIVLGAAIAAAVLAIVAPILVVTGSLAMFGGAAWRGFTWLSKGVTLAQVGLGRLRIALLLARAGLMILLGPVGWIIAGLTLLGGVIYLVVRHWDAVKAAAGAALTWLQGVLQGVPDWILAAFPLLLVIKHWDEVKGAAGRALDFIRNLAGQFYQAGSALWTAFTDGIKAVVSQPVEAVKAGLQRIRNLLPFSDAKEGPLSALTRSGAAMLQTFAEGIAAAAPDLHSAVAGGLAGAMPALALAGGSAVAGPVVRPSVPAVNLSAIVDAQRRGNAGAGQAGPRPGLAIYGDVTIKVEKLDHPEDLMTLLQRLRAQEGR